MTAELYVLAASLLVNPEQSFQLILEPWQTLCWGWLMDHFVVKCWNALNPAEWQLSLQIVLVERIPFHTALYFVITTLTTGKRLQWKSFNCQSLFSFSRQGCEASLLVSAFFLYFLFLLQAAKESIGAVGYGDVVMASSWGKTVVLAMICVGVVLIPVQTSQLYSQLTARRITLGRHSFPAFLYIPHPFNFVFLV